MTSKAGMLATGLAALLALALPVSAQQHSHDAAQPYKGFEARTIKGLSASDIAQIEAGQGWGLALPAELNGKPGPAHLLELREPLGLSGEQVAQIEAFHAEMETEAKRAGARFIAAERALSDGFAGDALDEATLARLLDEAAQARAALRMVHLKWHLRTPPLLSEAQIAQYARLRGYADAPCAGVPEGHDAAMWRKHNNCE